MKNPYAWFALALALCTPAMAQQAPMTISPGLPTLATGERVASFSLSIEHAWVASMEGLPAGWSIELVNDPSSSERRPPVSVTVQAKALVGASYLAAADFRKLRFRVHPDGRLQMSGNAVLSKPPGTERTLPLMLRVGSPAPPDAEAEAGH